MASTDRWYLDHVTTLSDSELAEPVDFSFVDGSPGRMSRVEMLMHVITHGNYHRGAAGRILFQAGLTLPKDSLTVFMHQPQRQMA